MSTLQASLQSALKFTRESSPAEIFRAVMGKDTHPMIQFLKYAVFGVGAVAIYQSSFGLLGISLFPHFSSNHLPDFILASAIAFLLSDIFAYVANVLWVFQGGRHSRVVEFLLFTGVSSIGWIVGMIPASIAYANGTGGSWLASIIVTITSVIVNF
ncbi:MAG: GtrA family protein, partial [Verrucomicrobiota bacterium]